MTHTALVIPCYNEAERLPIWAFTAFGQEWEHGLFILVDDGSTDGTGDLLQALVDENPTRFELLVLPANRGKAEAVRQGLRQAVRHDPSFAGYWDADLSTPLDALPLFLEVFDTHPKIEMVFGARVKLLGRSIERRALRHYLGRIFATAASEVLQLAIYDTQCGAKLFRVNDTFKRITEPPFLSKWIFDIELIARFTAERRGTDRTQVEEAIYELPLPQWKDTGPSKVTPADALRAAFDLVRLYRTSRLR